MLVSYRIEVNLLFIIDCCFLSLSHKTTEQQRIWERHGTEQKTQVDITSILSVDVQAAQD